LVVGKGGAYPGIRKGYDLYWMQHAMRVFLVFLSAMPSPFWGYSPLHAITILAISTAKEVEIDGVMIWRGLRV